MCVGVDMLVFVMEVCGQLSVSASLKGLAMKMESAIKDGNLMEQSVLLEQVTITHCSCH